jgi:hypothetical protein
MSPRETAANSFHVRSWSAYESCEGDGEVSPAGILPSGLGSAPSRASGRPEFSASRRGFGGDLSPSHVEGGINPPSARVLFEGA